MSKKVNNDVVANVNDSKGEVQMSNEKMYAIQFKSGESYGVAGATRAQLEAMLKQSGFIGASIVEAKPIVKKTIDNFAYIDDNHATATCSHCGENISISSIPADVLDDCRKLGLCPTCLGQYKAFKEWESSHKAVTKTKAVVNGGKKVGERFRAAFNDAIQSPLFTGELILPWFEVGEASDSHKIFKFSTFPLLWNVTGMSSDEQKNYGNTINGKYQSYRNRFYAKVYTIGECQFKLCSQIYDAQFAALVAEFKRLGLLAEDAEY